MRTNHHRWNWDARKPCDELTLQSLHAVGALVPKLSLGHLAIGILGNVIDELNRAGLLVRGHVLLTVKDDGRLGDGWPRSANHDGVDNLPPIRVRQPDHDC